MEALAGAKQKIVVLDACRNNPLGEICPPATKAKLTFRDFKVPDAGNFLLVSSTKPGQVADDGLAGAHSPFARALLAALSGTPNVHFDQVFNRVSKTVIEETSKGNFTQIPEMLIRGGAPGDLPCGQGLRGRSAGGGAARGAGGAATRPRPRPGAGRDGEGLSGAAREAARQAAERGRAPPRAGVPQGSHPLAGRAQRQSRRARAGEAQDRRHGRGQAPVPGRPRRRTGRGAGGSRPPRGTAQEGRRLGAEYRGAGPLDQRGRGRGLLQARRGPRPR